MQSHLGYHRAYRSWRWQRLAAQLRITILREGDPEASCQRQRKANCPAHPARYPAAQAPVLCTSTYFDKKSEVDRYLLTMERLSIVATKPSRAPDDVTRRTFLDACRRHVADDGCVIIQQHSPEWFAAARDSEVSRAGVILRLRDVTRPAPNLISATAEYVVGDRCWTQTFITMRMDEAELAAALATAGLRPDRYLTEDHSWFRAVPVAVPG